MSHPVRLAAPARRGVLTRLALLAVVALGVTAPGPLRAADLAKDTALGQVPAEVAFFASMLNGETQAEAFLNSNAYQRIKQMPFVQLGLIQVRSMWNDPNNEDLAEFKQFLEQPENQELVDLAKSAFAKEVFFYGDIDYARQLALMQEISRAIQQVQFQNLDDPSDLDRKIARAVIEQLNEHEDDIRIPDTVVGFKIDDAEAANRQIDRLEQLGAQLLAEHPQLRERLRRDPINNSQFLSWDLDGSLLPWEELDEEDFEGFTPAERDRLIDMVKSLKLRLAIGVQNGYLLLSIGNDNEHLESFGKGESLANHPKLEPLRKHSDKTLTSIGFVDEDFLMAAGSVDQQLDDLVQLVEGGLGESDLSEKIQGEIIGDVRMLMEELKERVPTPGTTLSYAFLTDRGYEGYSHNYGTNPQADFSKPLTILKHVGGQPILFAAGRSKYSPEDYDLVAKILERSVYYAEQIALEDLPEEERGQYEKLKADVQPLLARLDKVSREKFFPAFKDGQVAFVMDATLSTGQIHQAAPTPRNALPLPEFALVAGVNDAEAVKQSAEAYFEIAQQLLDVARKYDESGEIPAIKLPAPESRPGVAGRIYYYPLPPHFGVDNQIAPAAGLSENFLTLALAPKTAERLLSPEPVGMEQGVLADLDRPLASAAHFDFAAFLDMLEPWVGYGIDVARAQTLGGDAEEIDPTTEIVKGQLAQVFEIMRCFRGGSSVTYLEGDVIVTHHEWRFEDLP